MLMQGFYLRTINRGTGKESEGPVTRCFIIHLSDMAAVISRCASQQKIAVSLLVFMECMNKHRDLAFKTVVKTGLRG